MDIALISQAIHATVGFDVEDYLNDYYAHSLCSNGFDPVLAFECRRDWDIEGLPVTLCRRDWESELTQLKSKWASLDAKLERLRSKSQLL